MRKAALLAGLLLAAAPADARAEVHLRVRPSVRAGAGYSSDLFLGADLGPSGEAQLAPSLRLDASLSPRLKLWSEYDLGVGLYEKTRSSALDHLLELGSRIRLAPRLMGELSVTGQSQNLSAGESVGEALGLEASKSRSIGLSPLLRHQSEGLRLELLYSATFRENELASGETIDDLAHAGLASIGAPLGPAFGSLAVRVLREDSSAPEFTYWAGGLLGSLALPLGPVDLRLTASGSRNGFQSGRRDVLLRVGVAPELEIGAGVTLEASYGYARNWSSDEAFDADRHFGYLGARWEGELWRR